MRDRTGRDGSVSSIPTSTTSPVCSWRKSARLVRLAGLATCALVAGTLAAKPIDAQAAPPALSAGKRDTLALSLADMQRLVLRQNLGLLADRQETAIARGGMRQARALRFNPDLALQSTGKRAASGGPFELTLTQEIEWAGQRGLRIGAADQRLSHAAAVVQNAGRLTLAEASVGFFRAVAAERRLAVTRDAFALNERLLAAVRIQLREGEISTLEANLAEIEFGRARGRVLAAQRAATSSTLEVKQLAGLGPDTPIVLSDSPSVVAGELIISGTAGLQEDSLIAVALARRPDLAASDLATREAKTLVSLARREAFPNLRLGAAAERVQGEGGVRIGPAVGLSLPLFNRNQGGVAQRRALEERALLDRRATELRVRTEVVNAARAYRAATEEAAVFESSVLRPAHENAELLETAFRAGKVSLPTLLLLRNQLLDAELGYWDAWLAQREAYVQLDAATGALALPAADPSDRIFP